MLMIPELRAFLIAAETENFSETGRRLGISQPAVSMQIRSLEQMLGADLFQRTGRSVTLTEAGEALVPLAEDIAHRTIRLEEAMASIQGEVVGRLRIACTTTAGKYVLPQLMVGLLTSHPNVSLECLVVPRTVALDRLREGEAHLAMASMREEDPGLEYRAFITDRIVLVVPPNHRWAKLDRPLEIEELRGEPFVMREENAGTYVALTEGLSWHDLEMDDLNVVMTLGNAEAIRMTVQTGIGVAFLSHLVAQEAVDAGKLATVPVKGLELSKTLYLIRNPDRPATRAQAEFWNLAFSQDSEIVKEITAAASGA